MGGFMNKELEAIRDSLVCGRCNCSFKGTDSQARKVKYEKQRVFCSKECRAEDARERLSTPIPERTCLHCDKTYHSRTAIKYCSRECYIASDQHEQMRKDELAKINELRSTGELPPSGRQKQCIVINCLECGVEINKPSMRVGKTKYCSQTCRKTYHSKRFDRWEMESRRLVVPIDYQQFLDREELPCIVEGCTWVGHALSNHMNATHGMTANELKEYLGFNRSAGIVSKTMLSNLKTRPLTAVALDPLRFGGLVKAHEYNRENPRPPVRPQAIQNLTKSRELSTIGPMRICHGCQCEFQQSTMFGYAKYCSYECRDKTYAYILTQRSKIMVRKPDGTFSWFPRYFVAPQQMCSQC